MTDTETQCKTPDVLAEETVAALIRYLGSRYSASIPKIRGMDLNTMQKTVESAIDQGIKSYLSLQVRPKVPKPIPEGWLQERYAKHEMIPRDELIDGQWYYGSCRNASMAEWDSTKGVFVYYRLKYGKVFPESIEHPEDDRGFDVFWPEFMVEDLRGRE